MTSPPVRLIASDLDGTLLGPDGRLSARTIVALQEAARRDIEVVAVTGRSHWSAVDRLRPAGCIRWIICSNGATVWDERQQQVVVERNLERAVVERVLGAVTEAFPNVGVSWETSTGVFETEQWRHNRQLLVPAMALRKSAATRPRFGFDEGPVRKLMLGHDRLASYPWLDAVSPHLPDGVNAVTSSALFVEITRADANKGDALAALCDQLGVAQGETIAFGDHDNDLPMLSWAGVSYAMSGADQRIQAAADHVAPTNAEDGVAQIIEALLQPS